MEKHPEADAQDLLEEPDTKVMWEKHFEETYYSYWEQYVYWAAQGWTVEHLPSGEACSQASDPMDENTEMCSEGRSDGIESVEKVRSNGLSQDIEVLGGLLEQNCSVEDAQDSAVEPGSHSKDVVLAIDCCTGGTQDSGNECNTPAVSSQSDRVEHKGKIFIPTFVKMYSFAPLYFSSPKLHAGAALVPLHEVQKVVYHIHKVPKGHSKKNETETASVFVAFALHLLCHS